MVTIDSTLRDIMQLDYASGEMLLEILQKRQIEARRDEIAEAARQSLTEYKSGNYTFFTANEAIETLSMFDKHYNGQISGLRLVCKNAEITTAPFLSSI